MVFTVYRQGNIMNEYTSHSTHQPEEIKMIECATYSTPQPQFSGDAEYEPVTHQPQYDEYETVAHMSQSRGDEDYEPVTEL